MSTEKEIRQWDRFYADGDKLMRIPDPRLVRELANVDPEGKAALVLGCGNGRHAIWLRRRGWHVVGVDYSREALVALLDWAREEGLGEHLLTWEVDLKDPIMSFLKEFKGKFDLVLAWDVLYYFNDDELHQLLEWLPGICAEGAQLLIWARGEKDRNHNPLFQSSDGFMAIEKRNHNHWRWIFKLNPNWTEPTIDERWETFGHWNEHYYLIRSGLK